MEELAQQACVWAGTSRIDVRWTKELGRRYATSPRTYIRKVLGQVAMIALREREKLKGSLSWWVFVAICPLHDGMGNPNGEKEDG